jgi:hypothetical protein
LPDQRSLMIGALSGPVLWALHFLTVYSLVTVTCRDGVARKPGLGATGVPISVGVATVATLAAMAVLGGQAFRRWRELRDVRQVDEARLPAWEQPPGPSGDGRDRTLDEPSRAAAERAAFMAFSGFMLNALFGLAVVLSAIPALVLNPCVWG